MFYGPFMESSQRIVPLPGKKAEDILELLLCLIPTPDMKPIDDSNMESMLALSDEYQISDLRGRVESYMMSKVNSCEYGDKSLLIILRMAANHHSARILEWCIKRCASEFGMEELEECADLPKAIISCVFLHQQMNSLVNQWVPINRLQAGQYCELCLRHQTIAGHCKRCFRHACNSCYREAHHCDGKEKAEADIKRMQDILEVWLDNL